MVTPEKREWTVVFKDDSEKQEFKKFALAVRDLDQEDNITLRFFRARERNLKNAEEMIRKSIAWKKANDIDFYSKWVPPPALKEDFGITFEVTGFDATGRPVFWFPIGSYMAKLSIECGYKADLYKIAYRVLETGQVLQREKDVSQSVVIMDFENLSYTQVMHYESMHLFYKLAQIMEQNYPEVMYRLIALNTPWVFPIAYNIIKPVLGASTVAKIELYNSDKQKWLQRLRELIPEACIPKQYLQDCSENDII